MMARPSKKSCRQQKTNSRKANPGIRKLRHILGKMSAAAPTGD
jgi:hypothetical protein